MPIPIQISYPKPDFKIKSDEGKQYIFDIIRKKYIVLTQEEWVRQNIIAYMIDTLKYSKQLISVEKKVMYGSITKRYDIVVYNKKFEPFILVECKQPNVEISDATLFQLLQYQKNIQAPFWILTNGLTTYCAHFNKQSIDWLEAFPEII